MNRRAVFVLTCALLFVVLCSWIAQQQQQENVILSPVIPVTRHTTNATTTIVRADVNLTAATTTCTMTDRSVAVTSLCDEVTTHNKPGSVKWGYKNILVDDRHKVLYCYVPKVGCTAWKHVIAQQSGLVRAPLKNADSIHYHEKSNGIFRLGTFNKSQIAHRLATYRTFLVARHPLTRLLSAYKDKFVRTYKSYGKVRYGRLIKELYPNLTNIDKNNFFLPFDKFVDMLLATYNSSKVDKRYNSMRNDEHLAPISKICQPCHIRYDYIAKIETMHEEQTTLLSLYNATQLPVMNVNSGHEAQDSPSSFSELFYRLPEDKRNRLFDIYESDFKLFGYKRNIEKGPECHYETAGMNCC